MVLLQLPVISPRTLPGPEISTDQMVDRTPGDHDRPVKTSMWSIRGPEDEPRRPFRSLRCRSPTSSGAVCAGSNPAGGATCTSAQRGSDLDKRGSTRDHRLCIQMHADAAEGDAPWSICGLSFHNHSPLSALSIRRNRPDHGPRRTRHKSSAEPRNYARPTRPLELVRALLA
jgi:hypothetical protein